jgi:hypothetical protein
MKFVLFLACVAGLCGCGSSSDSLLPKADDVQSVDLKWLDHPIWGGRQFEVHRHAAAILDALKPFGRSRAERAKPPFEQHLSLAFHLKDGQVITVPVLDTTQGTVMYKLGETYYFRRSDKFLEVVLRLSRLASTGTEDFDERMLHPDAWKAQDAPPIDSMTLYSLRSAAVPATEEEAVKKAKIETFYNYPVLGKLDIAKAADRIAILNAIQKGTQEPAETGQCFDPQHGVRLTRNDSTIDYLICFHCDKYNEYLDGVQTVFWEKFGESSRSVLDGYLRKARIPQE